MCEQCLAATENYGEPVPGFMLIRATTDGHIMKAGQWGLVEMNDPFLVFDLEPAPDPGHGMTDEEIDDAPSDHPLWAWLTTADHFRQVCLLQPDIGFELIETATDQCGYNRDKYGWFAMWLFHRMGELVEAKQ